ncbi:MAG: hypothetical protein LBP27_02225 [Treponema sp.]|nr:hypothetical protein [Treponema sp.]
MVYVAGFYAQGEESYPCYWNNGTLTPLESGGIKGQAGRIAVSGGKVYMAGFHGPSGNHRPCYWIGTEKHDLFTSAEADSINSTAEDIAVSGGKVYVAGQYMDGGHWQPCYWLVEGGAAVRKPLGLPGGGISGTAWAAAVSGSAVYIAGQYRDSGNEQKPCYWTVQGGTNTTHALGLPGGGISGTARAAAVSGGVVYIAGAYRDSGANSKPCYWTVQGGTNTAHALSLPSGATDGVILALAVSGSSVHAAGDSIKDGKENPCYWTIDGEENTVSGLTVPEGFPRGGAYGIAVSSGGNVYISGFGLDEPEEDKYIYAPCYWKDGTLVELDLGSSSSGGAGAAGIAVEDAP